MCSCSLFFFLPFIFTLVAANISHFLTSAMKFFLLPTKLVSVAFLFLALALSLLSTLI